LFNCVEPPFAYGGLGTLITQVQRTNNAGNDRIDKSWIFSCFRTSLIVCWKTQSLIVKDYNEMRIHVSNLVGPFIYDSVAGSLSLASRNALDSAYETKSEQ